MKIIEISDNLSIADQPTVSDIASLPQAGFSGLINLRPDGEEAAQAGNDGEAEAARGAKLRYDFIPVSTATITLADIRAFQAAVARKPDKVLAHCKSGMRALMLYALGEVLDGRVLIGDLEVLGQRHGFDLSAARKWLERHLARRPRVDAIFDPRTSSVQYVVADPETGKCAIVDPVLDYDEKAGAISTRNADALLAFITEKGLTVEWILDTHPHADHFSAARYLKEKTGAATAIGERVVDVQRLWKSIYNWPDFNDDGSQWDQLFADGETFKIGSLDARVLFSPGHTLASITYVIGDAAFIHDTLFMPDSGSARADFPGGDARMLWQSIGRILALPEDTRLFTGHDYQPGGRAPRWESTVAEQRARNTHVANIDEETFVRLRTARDRTLPMPKLILHALQVNMRGGRLPEPEANGTSYLKIPLNALEGTVW